MKKTIDLGQATRLINCGMLVLVTASDGDRATITPCAWYMPLSKTPPLVAIALAAKHFSSEAIQKSNEFALNIPRWHHLDKVRACGAVSGRTQDKFALTSLTKLAAKTLSATPLVGECCGHLECKLVSTRQEGDHLIFTGQVSAAVVEEEYFSKGFWDTRTLKLICHLGGNAYFASTFYSEFI